MTQKRPCQCGSPVTIVYKDNFKNFFQMTIHFLACAVTILRKLHFTRNYIFTLNISAEQLLFLQSGYFIGAPTFSEHLLLLSSYFFKIVTYLERNIYRPATSCDQVVIQGRQFFRTATFQKDKFVQNINIQKSFFLKQALLKSIKTPLQTFFMNNIKTKRYIIISLTYGLTENVIKKRV